MSTTVEINRRPVHPVADLFPMMTDEELADLAADIKANRLIQPIVIDQKGLLIDGRNRAKACEIAGIEPTVRMFEGDDKQLDDHGLDRSLAAALAGQKRWDRKPSVSSGSRRPKMPCFARYIGIDYSGAETPNASLKGLRTTVFPDFQGLVHWTVPFFISAMIRSVTSWYRSAIFTFPTPLAALNGLAALKRRTGQTIS